MLKNEKKMIINVPIEVSIYEDERGHLQVGSATWPSLAFLAKWINQEGTIRLRYNAVSPEELLKGD